MWRAVLFLAGAGLLVFGVGLLSIPAACILAGLIAMGGAYLLEVAATAKEGRTRRRHPDREGSSS